MSLRGYAKYIMYQTKLRDIGELKPVIRIAIATIDEIILQRTWQEIEYSPDVLRASKGTQI